MITGRSTNKLSAEVFETILANLRSDNTGRQSEKRQNPRVGLRAKLDISLPDSAKKGGQPTTVWVRDISLCGLGILTGRFMKTGMTFTAMFDRAREGTLNVEYTVTYCKTLSDEMFSVGARVNKSSAECTGCKKPADAAKPAEEKTQDKTSEKTVEKTAEKSPEKTPEKSSAKAPSKKEPVTAAK
jgi:PilZ domain-containing protein